MSFPRIITAGAPVNSSLTAAEFNALDLDHSNSAKSNNAADTIASQWTFSSTSTQSLASGATWTLGAGATATFLGIVSFKGAMSVGDGANPFTWEFKAVTTVKFDAAVVEQHANVVEIKGAGALLKTETGGRIQLGDGDYPTYSALRAHPVTLPLGGAVFAPVPSGWTIPTTDGLVGTAISTPAKFPLLPYMVRNGSTLALVELWFTPATRALGGGGPANAVNLAILRRSIVGGLPIPAWTSMADVSWSGGYVTYGDGTVVTIVLAPALVIDTTIYEYAVQITDENGSGAVSGNVYHQVQLSYNALDMKPA